MFVSAVALGISAMAAESDWQVGIAQVCITVYMEDVAISRQPIGPIRATTP